MQFLLNRAKPWLTALTLLLLSFGRSAGALAQEETKVMHFEIRDPETRALVFAGTETVKTQGTQERKETVYSDTSKQELYREDALYEKASLRMLDYEASNKLTGELTKVKAEGANSRVQYRADASKSLREEDMKLGPETFHPKMIHQLIVRHWQSLVAGKSYQFDMLLPFRFQSLGFQLVHFKNLKVGNEERESFLLQPKNFLIRAFVPRMEFQFAKGPEPEIRLYLGPCPVPVKGETNKTMEMVFLPQGSHGGV